MSSNTYADMTIPQLKDALRKRGAKLSGRKRELIERLESYDRNDNFGQVLLPDNYAMLLPDPTLYKDINSDTQLPDITEADVKAYLDLFGQDLRDKCKAMYHGKFLRSIRMATQEETTFIQARVSAEMMKKCIYKVDVKVDRHCVVQESQCECAAGMGPEAHCKHVAVTLYAVTQAHKGIITMETCTQVLQTFHQAKKYTGSPVKMADLDLRRSGGLSELRNFEPRPVELRNMPEYQDHFRNTWINSSARDLTIRQLYKPANMYGIVNDHDYLAQSQGDLFLERLQVTAITEDGAQTIEQKSRGQSSSKFWREERLLRLHSSNYGQICRLSEKSDRAKLSKSFTVPRQFSSDATKHGKKYESVALDEYNRRSHLEVTPCGIYVCRDAPYLGCSPDGLVGNDGIVEVKCPYSARDKAVTPMNVPYLNQHEDGTMSLDRGHNYYYQVMGTLACTGRDWCDFVVWTFEDCRIIRIPRDDEFIINLKSTLSNFFRDYFKEAVLETFLYRGTHLIG